MFKSLKTILEVQELDIKMLRLITLRQERQSELDQIDSLRSDLKIQLTQKKEEIEDLNKTIIIQENKISEIKEKLKKLENKQGSIKKVEEFNALTQEMTQAERERLATEQVTSDLIDKRNLEEEFFTKIQESLKTSEESSAHLEKEILASIDQINKEGKEIKQQRDALAAKADPEILAIYERLLSNKRDRVVVPIEHRSCNGCHIALTAQQENIVRKGERLVFCEHCSRILYWLESEELAGTEIATKRRRRRTTKAT